VRAFTRINWRRSVLRDETRLVVGGSDSVNRDSAFGRELFEYLDEDVSSLSQLLANESIKTSRRINCLVADFDFEFDKIEALHVFGYDTAELRFDEFTHDVVANREPDIVNADREKNLCIGFSGKFCSG